MEWIEGDLIEVALARHLTAIAFTANSTLSQGKLVMGYGAAKRVRDEFRGVDAVLGDLVFFETGGDKKNEYNLVYDEFSFRGTPKPLTILAVQVKYDWRNRGDWDLTKRSLERLAFWRHRSEGLQCTLNCPLIGAGGYADREPEVRDLVEKTLEKTDILVCTLPVKGGSRLAL